MCVDRGRMSGENTPVLQSARTTMSLHAAYSKNEINYVVRPKDAEMECIVISFMSPSTLQ